MHSFVSTLTALVATGFFALTVISAPSPRNHPSRPGTAPSPVPASAAALTSRDPGSGTPGQAVIVNQCTFPAYVTVCKQHPAGCGPTVTLAASTGTYSEPYAPASDGGHSIKISTVSGGTDILQFEYSNEGDGFISYDLSEVNGNPFGQWGFSLTNTTADSFCAPPATDCPAIFTQPTNGTPYTCADTVGTGATLCG